MKKWVHRIWAFLQVIIILYVVCVVLLLFCRNQYGYIKISDYTLANGSLTNIENVKESDLIVIKNSSEIKEKDKIYYYAASNDSYVIYTDNVVSIEKDGSSKIYTIDKNGQDIVISEQRVLGKSSHVYSGVGRIINALESRKGFILFVLLPIFIVFVYQIFEFRRELKSKNSTLPEEKEEPKEIEVLEDSQNKNEDNTDDIEIL